MANAQTIWCRCGKKSVDREEVEGAEEYKCNRVCNKKKSCKKHWCKNRCCVDTSHVCDLICGKDLSCGQHYCNKRCHKGPCGKCQEDSSTELTCHCGATVISPPVPCGTLPPECSQPCTRSRPCGHPSNHNCHSADKCPPCSNLTDKMCVGEHERLCNIPCYETDVTCSTPCGKPLPCGDHNCQKICHKGPCLEPAEKCKQPCPKKRRNCSHACAEPCHGGAPCPNTACKAMVTLTCGCGRRKKSVMCRAHRDGEQLNCDIVCLRNGYTDDLLKLARNDLEFVYSVEEEMNGFVEKVRESTSTDHEVHHHCFNPMPKDERELIHLLGTHYGCKSYSYDFEPQRYVMVRTTKAKAHLPTALLSEVIEREQSQPVPVNLPALSTTRTD